MIERETVILAIICFMASVQIMLSPASAGSLEPSASPGPTMKALDEIYNKLIEINCNARNQNTRFECVLGGTGVLDKNTGLVWARDANLAGTKTWWDASAYCAALNLGGVTGWRLPTPNELFNLLETSGTGYPKLPAGDPFNVQSGSYWSSTTTIYAYVYYGYIISMPIYGFGSWANMDSYYYVWPVRDGQ